MSCLTLIQNRWWLKFSLRSALLIVTLLCIWLAVESTRARRQKQAIATIQQLGGRIAFDYQLDRHRKWTKRKVPAAPQWLTAAIGDDYFRHVVLINFDEGSDPTDDDLAILQDLPDLRELTLMNRTKFTDAGLRNLSALPRLEVLALSGTKVYGSGLAHFRYPERISGLSLDNAPITDEALMHVGKMSNLKWLVMNNTKITDKGLAHLASLKSLESLQFRGTAVTDDGLAHLKSLSSLKQLLLDDTQTTPAGRARLKQALPGCQGLD
jgi:hypothetical protein